MNELIARFLDDRRCLNEAELEQLVRHLENHPAALTDMRAQLACDELLARRFDEKRAVFVAQVKQATASAGGVVQVAPVSASAFVAAVERRLGFDAARGRKFFLSWLLAGAVAVVVVAFLWLAPRPQAVLATATGDVRVWRNQATNFVTAGFKLRAGDWLLTGSNSAATVAFPGETTRLNLGAGAEFGFVAATPGKELKLTAGTMLASVARQSASHPMLIRTPTAKAEVLGTKFELSANQLATRMKVAEGRVLIARSDDESGVVVEATQSATVTATAPVSVVTPPLAETLNHGLLAHWQFENDGADSSGNGNNLSVSPGAAFSDGHSGKALDLHAANVDVESPRLALPPVFTISLWLHLNFGEARIQPLLGYDGQAAGVDDFWLSLPPNFPGSSVSLDVRGRQMGSHASTARGVIRAGRWQQLTVITDSTEGRAKFFVDGQEVTETAGLRRDFKLAGSLLIGRRLKGGPLPFDGQLDDLRIYGRALTTAEITALATRKELAE